jgi:predicted alpha/beta-hydrolase family hydrolase
MDFSIASHTIQVDADQFFSAESYVPASAKAIFVFAHGAGAGMHHSFMKQLSAALAEHGVASLRYQFLYMELQKKRPDVPAVAHRAVEVAINKATEIFPNVPVLAGGKSFGGRMTSQFLSSHTVPHVRGVVFVGFPLHPAGKPSVDRAAHLKLVNLPMLFLQGTKDKLAEWNLIEKVCAELLPSKLVKLEGADHSFKAPKQNLIPVLASAISQWTDTLLL